MAEHAEYKFDLLTYEFDPEYGVVSVPDFEMVVSCDWGLFIWRVDTTTATVQLFEFVGTPQQTAETYELPFKNVGKVGIHGTYLIVHGAGDDVDQFVILTFYSKIPF